MFEVTKNDLSYNHTKLDFAALTTTAQLAYVRLLREISSYCSQLSKRQDELSNIRIVTDAQYLAQAAKNLIIVTETLSTLLGAVTRQKLEVVNKPYEEVKED